MAKVRSIALFALALLLLSACGSSTPEPANITIEMDEYTFTPEAIQLQVGQQVTITLVNTGALDHELMLGRLVVRNDDGVPTGFATDVFANAGVTPEVSGGGMLMDHSDEHAMEDMGDTSEESMAVNMVSQPAGSDPTTITFTVTEDMVGTWEMGCFEQDGVHYVAGMIGELTVIR